MTGARRRRREKRDDRSGGYLSELRDALSERGIRLTKRLGQHFLIDPNLNRRIARAASPEGGVVLEIGPGAGSLTAPLLAAGSTVIAVELDRALASWLAERHEGDGRIEVVHADALDHGRVSDATREAVTRALARAGATSFRVISNLPYGIASTFLIALACSDLPWEGGAVVLQREVAERLAASPGTKEYGAASVVWQLLARERIDRTIPREVFWPMPEVESALLLVEPRDDAPPELAGRGHEFGEFLKAVFSQRRKVLRSAMKKAAALGERSKPERVDAAIEATGAPGDSRAENLRPDQLMAAWLALAAPAS